MLTQPCHQPADLPDRSHWQRVSLESRPLYHRRSNAIVGPTTPGVAAVPPWPCRLIDFSVTTFRRDPISSDRFTRGTQWLIERARRRRATDAWPGDRSKRRSRATLRTPEQRADFLRAGRTTTAFRQPPAHIASEDEASSPGARAGVAIVNEPCCAIGGSSLS